jgi:TusA-related sulfurtransferase
VPTPVPTPVPTLVLDCRALRCPLPVIELARRIEEVAVGEVVGVTADDPAAGPDIAAWCRMRGQEHLGARPGVDGVPEQLVRRLH